MATTTAAKPPVAPKAPGSGSGNGSAPRSPDTDAVDASTTATKGIGQELKRLATLWPLLKRDAPAVWTAVALIPIVAGLQTAPPMILRYAVDHGITEGDSKALTFAAGLFAGAVVLEYLARAGHATAAAYAVHRMIRALRRQLVDHILRLPAAFHDRSMSGALVSRATGDIDNLSESLNMGVLTAVVDFAVLLGCIIGMFMLDWRLALGTLIVLPIVGGIVRWFSRALKAAMLKARTKSAAVNAFAQECLYGHATIKALVAEKAAISRHDKLCVEFRDAQMSSVVLDALMFAVLDGIAAVTTGLVLWLAAGGEAFSRSGVLITAGVLVAFVQYVQQFFEPLKQLGNKMAMLQGAFASLERVFGVLERQDKVAGDQPVPSLEGEVRFEDVRFRYREGGAASLDGVSFSVRHGESLALVGPTGSGKSTIVKLLTKLYDGYEGKITIDGQDIAAMDPWALRRRVAIVPQDIALFDGTIAFNISLGDPEVDQAHIEAAARLVGADRFIDRFPSRYEHAVREQGSNLSHGQRQLIAFARALARDPALVVLDEATSAVDPESEALVQEAVARLLVGRTVVVIAHRLSTVRRCDAILVLRDGKVVEQGNHQQLLEKRGAYHGLHEALA